jgi:ATP synthase F0 subunit b
MIELVNSLALVLAEGGGEGFWRNPDIWRVVNLAVFLIVLIYIFRNKIRIGQVFDNRASAIVKDLEQARHDKQEAERKLAEIESRLSRLDEEVAEIKLESERESAREAERIREATAADAEKIRLTAEREVEGAVKAARNELRAFVAEQAVEMAESIIRREIKPEDEKRLLTKYVNGLGEVNK